jgi:hypothetical protein
VWPPAPSAGVGRNRRSCCDSVFLRSTRRPRNNDTRVRVTRVRRQTSAVSRRRCGESAAAFNENGMFDREVAAAAT